MTVRRLSPVLPLLGCISYAAYAGTFYVANSGSDASAGSQTAPFRTIQRAVQVVRAGDTVVIRRGRYAPFALLGVEGSAGKPITFQGEAGAVVDMMLAGAALTHAINVNGGSYVTIDGLEVTDTYQGPGPTGCAGTTSGLRGIGIKLNRKARGEPFPHHLVFSNLHIHDTGGGGIGGSGEYIQFINNHVHHNGGKNKGWTVPQEAYGTYLKGRYNLIRGNRFHDHSGMGIRTGNDPSTSTTELLVDSTIENNIIYDNGGTWLHPHGAYSSPDFRCVAITGGDGIVIWHGSGNLVRNNIVYRNVGYGIRANHDATLTTSPNLVYNNTVFANGLYGIYSYVGEPNMIKNNISYRNKGGEFFEGIRANNLATDPKFVNAAAGDFHLLPGSTAVDTGVMLREVPTDFEGRRRPTGATHDIGAFEGGQGGRKPQSPKNLFVR